MSKKQKFGSSKAGNGEGFLAGEVSEQFNWDDLETRLCRKGSAARRFIPITTGTSLFIKNGSRTSEKTFSLS